MDIPSLRKDSRRLAVFAIVLALHVLVGAGFWRYRHDLHVAPQERTTAPILLYAEEPDDEPGQQITDFTPLQARPYLPAPSAITLPSADESPLLPDWDEAGKRAAARVVAGSNTASTPAPPTRPSREFGWDHSAIKRWEAAPGGGTVVRINDHCEIVFAPLPLGGCSLGKIPARGDLFEGMRESPDAGEGSVPKAGTSSRQSGASASNR